jgi:hypothetical protein
MYYSVGCKSAGRNAVGVLDGMGVDGAEGY